MAQDFRNRQDYWTPALALVVWAAHFSAVWAASIIFPGQAAARWLALLLTLAAAGALYWLWLRAGRPSIFTVPGLGVAIAAAGVLYDVLPAMIG